MSAGEELFEAVIFLMHWRSLKKFEAGAFVSHWVRRV